MFLKEGHVRVQHPNFGPDLGSLVFFELEVVE